MASSTGVHQSASDLRLYFEEGRWLGYNNVYSNDPINSIKRDIKSRCINSQDMREYIAASILLHLIEGWEYLGQALYAQAVRGAPIAIHLGYYAEMRATMSILATQGIGIFNRQHLVVDKEGIIHPMSNDGGRNLPTHRAIWLYLEHWLSSGDAGKILGKIIRPLSIPLAEWIDAMPCTGEERWTPVASDMLKNFGVDLQQMEDDRYMRNEASYRPFELSSYKNPGFSKVIKYLSDTVHKLEPSTARGGFDILDQHLLCQTLEKVFISVMSKAPKEEPVQFRYQITTMLNTILGRDSAYADKIENFILSNVLYLNRQTLINLASDSSNVNDPLPLLSRAVLLLRLATGLACEFMKETDIKFEMLKFWWSRRGWEIGLWKDINRPVQIADLWADVDSALKEIEDWINSEEQSARSFYSKCARSLYDTTNLGRLAIIGLAS